MPIKSLTPLFPETTQKVTIQQGRTGDCYLLASLDCLFNGPVHQTDKLKQLFEQTDKGVTVRIPFSPLKQYLDSGKLTQRYHLVRDEDKQQDIITIPNQELERIDKDPRGVQSNALAVKILERLSTYYFVEHADMADNEFDSCAAHSLAIRRFDSSSTSFVARLLGYSVEDTKDTSKIKTLMTILPYIGVYSSFEYTLNHSGRHALRLKKISHDTTYEFANPWNNQETEQYTVSELENRNIRFSLFYPSVAIQQLTDKIISLPVTQTAVLKNAPNLYSQLSRLYEQNLIDLIEYLPQILDMASTSPDIHLFCDQLAQVHQASDLMKLSDYKAMIHQSVEKKCCELSIIRTKFDDIKSPELLAQAVMAARKQISDILNSHNVNILKKEDKEAFKKLQEIAENKLEELKIYEIRFSAQQLKAHQCIQEAQNDIDLIVRSIYFQDCQTIDQINQRLMDGTLKLKSVQQKQGLKSALTTLGMTGDYLNQQIEKIKDKWVEDTKPIKIKFAENALNNLIANLYKNIIDFNQADSNEAIDRLSYNYQNELNDFALPISSMQIQALLGLDRDYFQNLKEQKLEQINQLSKLRKTELLQLNLNKTALFNCDKSEQSDRLTLVNQQQQEFTELKKHLQSEMLIQQRIELYKNAVLKLKNKARIMSSDISKLTNKDQETQILKEWLLLIHNLEMLTPSRENLESPAKLDNFHQAVCKQLSDSLSALTKCQSSWQHLYPIINALVKNIAIITNIPVGILLTVPKDNHKLFFFSQPPERKTVTSDEKRYSLTQ